MKAYRYTIDYFDEGVHGFGVNLREFNIIKETPCGFFILYHEKRRFVPAVNVKQPLCHKEKSAALFALQKRRERYAKILKHNLRANELHLQAIELLMKEQNPELI